MRFGAASWPFNWDPPYEDAVRRVASLGFRAVEIISWDREILETYYTAERVKALRSLLDEEGLIVSQFIAKPGALAAGDPAARAEAVDYFKRFADTAVALGAEIINMVTDTPFGMTSFPKILDRPKMQTFTVDVSPGLDWDRNWLDYVEGVRACAEYAGSVGLRYSLEPHPQRYGGSVQGILRLLDAVDHPALGVNYDPSHLFALGEMPNVGIYQLNRRIIHVHASDNDGQINVHWRPGKGKIDWLSVFKALADVGYDGTVSLEFEDVQGVSLSDRSAERPMARGQSPRPATPEFDEEYRIALAYLTGVARDAGLDVEEAAAAAR